VIIVVMLPLFAANVLAQTLYKYRGADGHWVYSDRLPADLGAVEPLDRSRAPDGTGVWLEVSENDAGESVLIAVNGFASWVQIAYRIEASRNLQPDISPRGNSLLPPLDETVLMTLPPIEAKSPVEVSFSYQYLYGHPGARHRPDEPYLLPYPLAAAHRVSQAFPDVITHDDPANRHAIDFEMPTGTPIRAARSGVVVDTTGEFSGSGSDPETSVTRANFVRILHDDGTLALYGHLNWQSIRVEPGQRVARGEHIADSGNTGYSSGPHLHFVVQRNRAGAMESVPVGFASAAGAVVSPATGDRLVAY
jgi:murein DD-endopeptidase MepM/ murein hydrolase activator NlpD